MAGSSFTDAQLSSLAEVFVAQMASGQRTNTRRAYEASLRLWAAWYALRFGREIQLPVGSDVVLQFLRDFLPRDPDRPAPLESVHAGPVSTTQHALPPDLDRRLVRCGYKRALGCLVLSSVRARLSALNLIHRQHGLLEPTLHTNVVVLICTQY